MATKKENRRDVTRRCRRIRKQSDAMRDTMRDVKRGYGKGIPK